MIVGDESKLSSEMSSPDASPIMSQVPSPSTKFSSSSSSSSEGCSLSRYEMRGRPICELKLRREKLPVLKKDYYEDVKPVLEWKYKIMQVLKTYRVLLDLMRIYIWENMGP